MIFLIEFWKDLFEFTLEACLQDLHLKLTFTQPQLFSFHLLHQYLPLHSQNQHNFY